MASYKNSIVSNLTKRFDNKMSAMPSKSGMTKSMPTPKMTMGKKLTMNKPSVTMPQKPSALAEQTGQKMSPMRKRLFG